MSRYLVTGGSRGIGRSICLRFARDALARGATPKIAVSATGASPDLYNLAEELRALGADVLPLTGDLNDAAEPARLVAEAVAFCDGLDAVVHNAGGPIASSLVKTSLENWDSVMNINLRAFFLLGQAAHPELRKSKGSLCAIGSNASEKVQPFLNAYPVAKTGLIRLVEQMAYEWGRHGIRVNAVSPGLAISRSTEVAFATEEDRARAGRHIPIGRVSTADEIAAVVAFVTGPDASYVTGENINVDGGLRLLGTEAVLNESAEAWSAHDAGRMRPQNA